MLNKIFQATIAIKHF